MKVNLDGLALKVNTKLNHAVSFFFSQRTCLIHTFEAWKELLFTVKVETEPGCQYKGCAIRTCTHCE